MDVIREICEFKRFYARLIHRLDQPLSDSGFSLVETRVIYELAARSGQTAAGLGRTLEIDKAQLSRVLRRLKERQLVKSEVDPVHAKRRILTLSAAGRVTLTELDRDTRLRIKSALKPMTATEQSKLVSSMRDIQSAFHEHCQTNDRQITLRSPGPGDLGWVIHRQAVLYAHEYGWDWTYEALIAEILGRFAADFDPSKEDGWIAEQGGQVVGSVFLMKSDNPTVGKLRLLYVEPGVRGCGLGRRLVETCVERACALGYHQLTLWTNDVLVSARRIYEATGFRLAREYTHRSFGRDLVGQVWELELSPSVKPDGGG